MNIIIAGDFCPQDRIKVKIANRDMRIVSPELTSIISSADYSIINFECPIVSDLNKPIQKKGPNLKCTPESGELIKEIGFNCCTLANNHFRDYGDDGCKSTTSILDSLSIDYLGGGKDLRSAQKVLVREIAGKRIALVNICEKEFSVATDNHAGSAPLDLIDHYYQIKEARYLSDYVIVIVHGGHEHFQYPSHRMKKTYHWFADMGADVIVNHHQHCYSGYEIYNGVPIFYGLGNFCFDWSGKRNNLWTEGFLLSLKFQDSISFDLIPYVQCREEAAVREMSEMERKDFFSNIETINQIIADDERLGEIIKSYYTDCISNSEIMMGNFSDNRMVRWLKRKGLLTSTVSKEKRNVLYDYIFCESHRDKIEYWLNNCKL